MTGPNGMSIAVAAICAVVGITGDAEACPRCAAGEQARSEMWNQSFTSNLTATVLPFVIVAAASAYAGRTWGRWGSGATRAESLAPSRRGVKKTNEERQS